MKDSKLFCCFSVPLMKHLTENGIRYEVVALHKGTGNTMWIYLKDDKLKDCLSKWNK